MKKILFPLIDTNKGGNILSTISIFDKIDTKKFKIYVLLISTKGVENKIFKLIKEKKNINKKIHLIYINSKYGSIFFHIFLNLKLFFFIFENKFDLIHTNDGFLNSRFSILKIFYRFKLIIHLRNTDNSRRNYLNFYLADKIICISKFVKNKIPIKFKFKAVVLYNYVQLFNKNIQIQKNHFRIVKANKDKKIIFFISNLHQRKKPLTFIKIINDLNKRNRNYIGMMFFQSSQNQYSELRQFIKKSNLANKIYLFCNSKTHYWIPFARKFQNKILLSTSINEPLGRNLIEAILSNIIVVANNSGGHKEIINKKNGILTNTENIKDTSKLIDKLFKKKKLEINKPILLKELKEKFQNKKYFFQINKIYGRTIR